MKLSSKARYAVMAMMVVAINDRLGPVTLADVAKHQNISMSYLEQLFSKLRQAGLVDGVRGPGGGYRLGYSADQISIAAIVSAVESAEVGNDIADKVSLDVSSEAYLTTGFWHDLSERIHTFLDGITLAEFVERPGIRRFSTHKNSVAGQIAGMFPPSASAM